MTRYNRPRLLTPPREEEEIYPYHPVWVNLGIQVGVLFSITFALYVMVGFIGINAPETLWQPVGVALALTPALLWVIFAWLPEMRVQEPRRQLLSVFVVSALVANAVGIPLINYLEVTEWLSLASALDRIIGYAVTIGIIQEMSKYVILQVIAWPDSFRIRSDVVAYALTSAIGYATVNNLHIAFGGTISPDVLAIRVFGATSLHIAASGLIAYGLAELRFNPRAFIAMPLSMIAAAAVTGAGITFRAGLTNGNFVLGVGGARPIFGLAFAAIVVTSALLVTGFLFNAAERQAREAELEE